MMGINWSTIANTLVPALLLFILGLTVTLSGAAIKLFVDVYGLKQQMAWHVALPGHPGTMDRFEVFTRDFEELKSDIKWIRHIMEADEPRVIRAGPVE